MAVTGAGLFGFVVMHMLGNLQIFLGRETLNEYAELLKSLPELLWPARIGLLAMFLVHTYYGVVLTGENMAARPNHYVYERTVQASWASRHMLFTGLMILLFTIYHLLHFTLHVTNPEYHAMEEYLPGGEHRPDVYAMVVAGFSNPLIAIVYVVAQIFLGLHLSHGVSSMCQTLGLMARGTRPALRMLGPVAATVIVLGNSAIPLAVLFGFIKMPGVHA